MSPSIRSEKSELEYQSLPERVHFWTSLSSHAIILILAILIRDVSVVFEFAGTISCSFATFYFPGIGYLLALKKYGTDRTRTKWRSISYAVLAWTYIVLGSLAIIAYFSVLILKAI